MARRPFTPKVNDVGARVEWTQNIEGLDFERAGTVWSLGLKPATVWVTPEFPFEGELAVLLYVGSKGIAHRDTSWTMTARCMVRRANAIRAAGALVQTYDEAELPSQHNTRYSASRTITTHLPACPSIAGHDFVNDNGGRVFSILPFIDVVLGRHATVDFPNSWPEPKWCIDCLGIETLLKEKSPA